MRNLFKNTALSLAIIAGLSGAAKAEEGFLDNVRSHINGFGVRTTHIHSLNLSFPEYSLETDLGSNLRAGLSVNPVPFTNQSFDYGNYRGIKNSVMSGNFRLLRQANENWLVGGETGITREHLKGSGVNKVRYPVNYSAVSDYRIADHAYLSGRLGITGLGRWLGEFDGNGYDGTLDNLTVSVGLNVR